jgi:UDP-2,4-diacetamido-2,4,6-trideoxy-beta-L-altropyranose hydrolase
LEIDLSYKNILIRADSSSTIGTGHIMRDIVLARQYKSTNITFATQDLDENINDKIKQNGYKISILKSNDIKELDKIIKKLNIDLLIIDHYEIDYKKEKKLKKQNPNLTIFSFDDTYKKHYCDILLNHNIYAKKKKYKNKVPKNCDIKCGSKYTLLRDEFIKEKNKKYKPNKKFTFFIAMGGADTANLNIKILNVLKKFDNIEVTLVTTPSNKNLKKLQNYCANKNWIKLHIDSQQIAKLMKKSDYGIITPSVTANELYFLNKPFLAIQSASNQKFMTKYLKNKNYKILKSFNKTKLKKQLCKIL